ncbi:MAG: sigma-54-dependent Fis family transcriptional regulator [Planctomycetes bacterium]|nr:sigma-54-dependent Fis family transcriptional regulator [Planctomycetota bacterium]MCB9824224.1 sigma-54-dependent Fis family transcriptional regulator [Planctomycetota bacterium]MCB9828455.1 sigma-54-dependent Fis family transcriptional regulator [Planctomycetota bacterium]MCB9900222.1 sigma-54-dependent Fis family transcriptional regulator [Planctomycetota bacterium]
MASEGPRVLVVEDDAFQREALAGVLGDAGFDVVAAEDVASATRALQTEPDALVTDFHLPDGTGLDVIRESRALAVRPAALLVTAYGTISLAVDAMREGAMDVQVKPVDPAALVATLRRALRTRALELENAVLRERLARDDGSGFVAASPALRTLLGQVARVAPSRATVLVTGESGTGKEMIAALLHRQGGTPDAPLVAVNCAALPESLLEAELFGHARGAFTGAHQERAGRFEEARGGTLFLDEIGEVPLAVQAKLLRALEAREIVRLGENRPRPVDFRLVAATNVDLEAEVAAGRFREDLYYRLAVIRLHVPPLRQRPEDVRPLVARFLKDSAERNGVPVRALSEAALERLVAYPFPGNVRQLRNVVESALLMAPGARIEAEDLALPSPRADALPEGTLVEILEETERRLIRQALAACDGVTAAAAERLGIPDRTLRHKIQRLGLRGSGND